MLMVRKTSAVFLAALLVMLTLPVTSAFAADATGTDGTTTAASSNGLYSLQVDAGKVDFMKDGQVAGSHQAQTTDLTLSINNNDNLVVSFPGKNGKSTAITLGGQRTLEVNGTVRSLTAHSSLGGSVVLTAAKDANISTMTLNAPVETHIFGRVGTLNVQSAADVIVEKNASVTTAKLANANAMLTANGSVKNVQKNPRAIVNGNGVAQTSTLSNTSTGTSIARSQSGLITDNSNSRSITPTTSRRTTTSSSSAASTTVTSGSLRLIATTIYADYRDQLRTLHDDLVSAVRVYNTRTGNQIRGDVYWIDDEYREVTQTGTYSYAFEPTTGNYGEVRGRVRIVVDGRDPYRSGYRYDPYYDDYYYNDDYYYDDYYDDYYDRGTRSYYLEIDDDLETGVTRDEAEDGDFRLEDFDEDLQDAVKAFDRKDDDEIDGEIRWVSPNKKIRSSGNHEFKFIPDDSRYPIKRGRIRVVIDKD